MGLSRALEGIMQDLWYVRRESRVKGPFPCKMIVRSIARGQLLPTDEVSPDGSRWTALQRWERQFSAAANEPRSGAQENVSRAAEARQNPIERTPLPIGAGARPGPDSARLAARQRRREEYIDGLLNKRENRSRQIAVIGSCVAAIFLTVTVLVPQTVTEPPQCQANARPGVNWHNCSLEARDLSRVDLSASDLRNAKLRDATLMGARLSQSNLAYADLVNTNISYADLSGARLIGANLQRADLSYANLQGANLAYADLTGANMGGSELRESRFDNAIWTDGRVCGAGSVGGCERQ